VSSRIAAFASCAAALANGSAATVPNVGGADGSVGYSSSGSVGSPNSIPPARISTVEPETCSSTGPPGSDCNTSANTLPGTKISPVASTGTVRSTVDPAS
jgi:hypothetical protein